MVYQWENTQIVLDEGILEVLTMCLKSLKASKKLYAVGEQDIDFSKNLDVEKQVGMFIFCVKAVLDLGVPVQTHCS